MCDHCDYSRLMDRAGLGPTSNRLRVMEVIGSTSGPVKAQEIHRIVNRTHPINRVTVYRILDLLVEKGLVDRISGGGRSFYYGLAPNENHAAHPHFYCTRCGSMQCLNPEALQVDSRQLDRTFAGMIENVEIRFDGVCKTCLKNVQRAAS